MATEKRKRQRGESRGKTVLFNVGGKKFEVLRKPTLATYPSSLLSQLAGHAEGRETIFVEANSELFQFMLDFHRHRKIHIPLTVSKDAILREACALKLPVKPEDVVVQEAQLGTVDQLMADTCRGASEEIAISLRANRCELLRDLVLQRVVKEIKAGKRPVEVALPDLIKEEGLGSLHEQVSRQELEGSLQPWARKHSFLLKVTCGGHDESLCVSFTSFQSKAKAKARGKISNDGSSGADL
eukprot:CAMPEP_0171070302 /NCGR_PEP_ID=MMETSP0766_2-20121228/9660_1 /TAXON_ID=439317 /ORGANISM="Gambierdiscus australes, Strain CAWD 149" /LENGTH=240 /DNA_ID=CAMNT_0011526755 /DNA_START=30 /DNA_END=749 /DNA_ORIENTATION=+